MFHFHGFQPFTCFYTIQGEIRLYWLCRPNLKKGIFRDRCFQTHIKITTQQSIFLTNTLVVSTNLYFGSNNGIATASLQLMIYPTF